MLKLLNGVAKFQREVYPQHQSLFENLSVGQKPEVLFITCADSRIDPCMLTQTEPGELFICRNAGNMVPAAGEMAGGVSATIEYAVTVLRVEQIVVCGHSDCGAMRGLMHPKHVEHMKTVAQWLEFGASARAIVEENYSHLTENHERLRVLTEQNVLAQLDHLRTHPAVAARLRQGTVRLDGWYYEIPSGEVYSYNDPTRRFIPLAEDRRELRAPERVA